mgnify:CR=1 FL=1
MPVIQFKGIGLNHTSSETKVFTENDSFGLGGESADEGDAACLILCIEFLFASTSKRRREVTIARTPILPLPNWFIVRGSVALTERQRSGVEDAMFSPAMSILEINVSPDSPEVC